MKKFLISEKQLKYIVDNFDLLNEQEEKPETEVNKYCKYFKDKDNNEKYECSLLLNYPDNIIQPYTTNKTILPELDKFINSIKLLINSKFNYDDKFVVSVEAGASTPCATASLKPGYEDKIFLHGFGKNIKQSVGGSRDCIDEGNKYLAEQRQKFMIKLISKQLNVKITEGETKTNDSKYSKINIVLIKKPKVPIKIEDKFRWDYLKVKKQYPGNSPLLYNERDITGQSNSWKDLTPIGFVQSLNRLGLLEGSKQIINKDGNVEFQFPTTINMKSASDEINKYFTKNLTDANKHITGKELYDILNTQIPSLQGKLLENPPLQVDRVINR